MKIVLKTIYFITLNRLDAYESIIQKLSICDQIQREIEIDGSFRYTEPDLSVDQNDEQEINDSMYIDSKDKNDT